MRMSFKNIVRYAFILCLCSNQGIAAESSSSEADQQRIYMLEKALAPDTADKVAHLFAQANKNRNGAVQFMLFSDELKKENKDNWPAWVSGTSSPWITSYSIKKIREINNHYQFKITYQWATADGPFKPNWVQVIEIEPIPKEVNSSQKLWISKLTTE